MYNEASIQTLEKRIGWAEAVQPSTIVLSPENGESTSGRYFNGFNPLAIIENVNASVTNKDVTEDVLNEELARIRHEGVLDVLSKVYNNNVRATAAITNNVTSVNYALSYDDTIIIYQQAFDDAIGLSVVVKTLELLKTTNRSNNRTQNPNLINEIQEYFHGAFTQQGQVITKGLYAQYRETIGRLIEVLFPVTYPDGVTTVPDGNGGVIIVPIKKPTLRGRSVW